MKITMSAFWGGRDDDMSMDGRDVMPRHMERKENESRQEGRMGG
jgi:hypothetical protein